MRVQPKAGAGPARLRQISVVLMLLAALLLVFDGGYVLVNLSASPTTPSLPPRATPTLSPSSLYLSLTHTRPVLFDPLDGKQPAGWSTYHTAQSAYSFTGAALHATMAAGIFPALIECPLRNETFGNFALQIQ